ncbi:MAG: DUF4926 domain-containing protein [Pyrinomonadaceae bacterium]
MVLELELYDVVSLISDLEKAEFEIGTQGTIVQVLEPSVFLVEFDGDAELILPVVKQEQLKLVWRKGLKTL